MAELTQREKLTHFAVRYTHPSPHPGKRCGNCAHFIVASPARCEHVKEPIRRQDWCEKYAAR